MARRDDYESNPFAAPDTDLDAGDFRSSGGQLVYAGFWQRFVAAFVDGIITNILAMVLGGVAGFILGVLLREQAQAIAPFVGGVIGLVTGWLYSALQESSESRATLGKKMMGIQVVTLDGGQISFGQATGRHFAKLISGIILLIGYLMQPFTERKQALHDIMASTLVIKS